MTTPTKEQLAPNVPPLLRDYIDACISEAVEKAKLSRKLQVNAQGSTQESMRERMAQMEQFERQVRSHLGIFVPE